MNLDDRAHRVFAAVETRPAGQCSGLASRCLNACIGTWEPTTTRASFRTPEPSTDDAASTAVLTDINCTSGRSMPCLPGLSHWRFGTTFLNSELRIVRLVVYYDELAAYYDEEHETLQSGQPPRVSAGIGELPAVADVHRVLDVRQARSGELEGI